MVARRRHWGARARPALVEVVAPREAVAAPAIRIGLDQVDPSPRNPRRRLDVGELAASIDAYGLLQPVVVREKGARYELVAGHRRLAAVRQLAAERPDDPRWREIDAVLRRADDEAAYLLTLTENLQRADLHPKEEAAALEVLVRQEGWSVRKVAEAIHRDPAYVSRRLRVFDDPVLAGPVLAGRLPVSTAEELLRAPPDSRGALADRAVVGGWSQGEARRAVRGCCVTQHPDSGAELLRALRRARGILEADGLADVDDRVRSEVRRLLGELSRLGTRL